MDSEKVIEKRLNAEVKSLGGWSLKLLCQFVTGLPDRLVLLPGGVIFFAEIKSTGKKPTAKQRLVHERIRRLGFTVHVIDSLEQLYKVLDSLLD
jgi:hypothetical protein